MSLASPPRSAEDAAANADKVTVLVLVLVLGARLLSAQRGPLVKGLFVSTLLHLRRRNVMEVFRQGRKAECVNPETRDRCCR